MRIRTLFLAIPLGLLPVAGAGSDAAAAPAPAGAQAPARGTRPQRRRPGAADHLRRRSTSVSAARTSTATPPGTSGTATSATVCSSNSGRYSTQNERLAARVRRPTTWAARISATPAAPSCPAQVKVWGQWDQIPMLMSRTTQTLFLPDTAPGVLEIDDAIQAEVQANAANLSTARPVGPHVRAEFAPAHLRQRRRVHRQERADARRERPAHEPRGRDSVWREFRPQQRRRDDRAGAPQD